MASVTFGPGTVLLGTPGTDFACEVLGGSVTHDYEDVGESRTMLCGEARAGSRRRVDGLAFEVENDLSAAGLYSYLLANDLQTVPFVYTPNTEAGAKWEGNIQVSLPAAIGADAYGAPLVSSVTWAGVGTFTFTEATAVAAAAE